LSEDGGDEDIDKFFDFGDQELRDLNEEINLKLKGLVKFVTSDLDSPDIYIYIINR